LFIIVQRPGYNRKSRELEGGTEPPKKPVTYTEIIQRLVSRFIHEQASNIFRIFGMAFGFRKILFKIILYKG
jgi:hypothetical protein